MATLPHQWRASSPPMRRRSALLIAVLAARRRGGPGRQRARARHRRDAAESRSRGLAHVAAHAGSVGPQPARGNRPRQCRRAQDGVDARPRARHPRRNAARLRRRHVLSEPERSRSGTRRRDGRPAVGVSPLPADRSCRVFPRAVHQPQPRDLRRHADRHERRRLSLRARRSHRQARVGSASCSTTGAARNTRRGRSSQTAKSSPVAAASRREARPRA